MTRKLWTPAAGAIVATLLLAGCSGTPAGNGASTSPTGSPGIPASATASTAPSSSSSASSSGGTAQASQSSTAAPTAADWKTYTDPDHRLKFDVPQEWTVQQVAVPTGGAAGALRIEVRDQTGTMMAYLQTGDKVTSTPCLPAAQRPYTVLASIPLKFGTASTDKDAIEPRFVYRLLQGKTSFYGALGITDHPGGADGRACALVNTVTVPKLGAIAFGSTVAFTPAAGGGVTAFDSIAEAQSYLRSAEFGNLQRMITSLSF